MRKASLRRPSGASFLGDAVERDQGLLEIGHGADLDRIVAADLAGIDVDMDQLGGRNAEGVFRIPGTAIRFAEAGAQRQDDVGIAACYR